VGGTSLACSKFRWLSQGLTLPFFVTCHSSVRIDCVAVSMTSRPCDQTPKSLLGGLVRSVDLFGLKEMYSKEVNPSDYSPLDATTNNAVVVNELTC
jgi:hypothetical protein